MSDNLKPKENEQALDALMYVLSDLDDDKDRLKIFCNAIIGDLQDNGFYIVHEDHLERIVTHSVEKVLESNKDSGFPRGAYFWG